MNIITFPENPLTTSGLSILLHGVISLPDAMSYDNAFFFLSRLFSSQQTRPNSVDPDEMPHGAAFHLGFHCLPKYPCRGHQYRKVNGVIFKKNLPPILLNEHNGVSHNQSIC